MKTTDDEPLGRYIRRIRVARGLNLPDVARALAGLPPPLRVSHPYLSQIELGQVFQPSRDRLESIAAVLGIPPENLLTKAGYPLHDPLKRLERTSPLADLILKQALKLNPADQQLVLDLINLLLKRARIRGER